MMKITSNLCEKCKYGTRIKNTYKESLNAWCCGYALMTNKSRVFEQGKRICPPGQCDTFEPLVERKKKPITFKYKSRTNGKLN